MLLRFVSFGLVALPAVALVERAEETERCRPGPWRIEDSQVGGLEDGVEPALAGEVDGGRSLQASAAREVVRVAIAILRGHRREESVLRRDVDEIDVGVA